MRSEIPTWMKEKRAAIDRAEVAEKEDEQRRIVSAQLITTLTPEFFQSFLRELKIATDALPVINLTGSYTSLDSSTVRIQVNGPTPSADMTFTDIHLETDQIRCTGLGIGEYSLVFKAASDSEVVVEDARGSKPMTANEASEFVMRRMVDHLEHP